MRFCVACFLMVCALLAGCSKRQDGGALAENLKTIDAYIKTGQAEDALSLLKKTEKYAYSASARIGVYKRYSLLGENNRAERVLKRAHKTLPENQELSAVYAYFLLHANRIDEALTVSHALEGGEYGSLYAEAVLKKRLAEIADEDKTHVFLRDELIPIYLDAYTGTQDEHWLRDSALVYLAVGNYMAAAALQPATVEGAENAYFWALVQFDAGNYGACLHTLSIPATGSFVPQMTALASDAYIALGDSESAEALRAPQINAWLHRIVPELPCSLFVNSALWSWAHEDYKRAYDLLLTAVTTYPDDISALVSYGAIAYEQTKEREMSDLEKSLRKTTLRTRRMAQYDARPKMLLSDALSRMDAAIERQRSQNGYADDSLLASRALLQLRSSPDMVLQARLAYIWRELEKNEIQRNLYPPLLVQLAVHELLLAGKSDEARTLFENYLDARYGLSVDSVAVDAAPKVSTDMFGGEKRIPTPVIPEAVLSAAFGDRAAQSVRTMDVWEGETAAYFALVDKNVVAARRIYEYVLYEALDETYAEVASAANLAVIYSSLGNKQKALELYGWAAGRSLDAEQKSTVLYRSAVLQAALGNEQDAKLSLEYCLSLDPSNAEARLLQQTLRF